MTPERLAAVEDRGRLVGGLGYEQELCAALRAAWAERDRLVGERDEARQQAEEFAKTRVSLAIHEGLMKYKAQEIRQRALEECLAFIDQLVERFSASGVCIYDIEAAIRKLMGDPLPDAEEGKDA